VNKLSRAVIALIFAFMGLFSMLPAHASEASTSSPAIPAAPGKKKNQKPSTRHRYKRHLKPKPGKKPR